MNNDLTYTIVVIQVFTNLKVFHKDLTAQVLDKASWTEPSRLNTCSSRVRSIS